MTSQEEKRKVDEAKIEQESDLLVSSLSISKVINLVGAFCYSSQQS